MTGVGVRVVPPPGANAEDCRFLPLASQVGQGGFQSMPEITLAESQRYLSVSWTTKDTAS